LVQGFVGIASGWGRAVICCSFMLSLESLAVSRRICQYLLFYSKFQTLIPLESDDLTSNQCQTSLKLKPSTSTTSIRSQISSKSYYYPDNSSTVAFRSHFHFRRNSNSIFRKAHVIFRCFTSINLFFYLICTTIKPDTLKLIICLRAIETPIEIYLRVPSIADRWFCCD
jgi:hypothetical protein